MDYYVHEVVRLGMLEIHRGTRPESPAFSRFPISLGSARQALNMSSNFDSLLEMVIINRRGAEDAEEREERREGFKCG